MHSLLGYRFDNLMREKMTGGPEKKPPFRSLSFRVPVANLAEEAEFFTRLLGITPLVENTSQVILPLANGITLILIAVNSGQPAPALELDMRVTGIQKVWQTARKLYHCRDDALSTSGTRRTFKVTSPSGIVLRLWQ